MNPVNRLFDFGEALLLQCGHGSRLYVSGGQFKGKYIIGRLDVEPMIDPDALLGADPRMKVTLRLRRPCLDLREGDTLLDDDKNTWRIISRENNAATITTDFGLEQQT